MSEKLPHALRARFANAMAELGCTRPVDALFDELVQRYLEPHRHYHTLAHVDACLAWLDWYAGAARRPAEVEIALWFHDAVYDPRRRDNEARSARLTRRRLAALGLPAESTSRIAAHVLATERHRAEGGDAQLVLDLDLTILGSSPERFAEFEREIRREYAHVPALMYRHARRRVLQGFLRRPFIYATPALRQQLEAAARANLRVRCAR